VTHHVYIDVELQLNPSPIEFVLMVIHKLAFIQAARVRCDLQLQITKRSTTVIESQKWVLGGKY